jgi:hypothetical protein
VRVAGGLDQDRAGRAVARMPVADVIERPVQHDAYDRALVRMPLEDDLGGETRFGYEQPVDRP